jgi:hypothetical protein
LVLFGSDRDDRRVLFLYSETMETGKTRPAPKGTPHKRASGPSSVGTNRDWVMIVLGSLLIVFFVAAGYASIIKTNKNSPLRKRGPVKYPKKMGSIDTNIEIYKTGKAMELARRLRDQGTVEDRKREVG